MNEMPDMQHCRERWILINLKALCLAQTKRLRAQGVDSKL